MGLFEVPPYDQGSRVLAQALADNHPAVVSIIAGGDTVAAVSAAGLGSRIAHLSTGGGATLEFLEGKVLPGIKALETNHEHTVGSRQLEDARRSGPLRQPGAAVSSSALRRQPVNAEVVLAPPFTALNAVHRCLGGSPN